MKSFNLIFNVVILSLFIATNSFAQRSSRGGSAPTQHRGDSDRSSPSRSGDFGRDNHRSDDSMGRNRPSDNFPSRDLPSTSREIPSSNAPTWDNTRSDNRTSGGYDTYHPAPEPTRPSRESQHSGTVRRGAPQQEYPRQRRENTAQSSRDEVNRTQGPITRQHLPQDGYATPPRSERRNHDDEENYIRRGVNPERRQNYGTSNYYHPYGHDRVTHEHGHVYRHQAQPYVYKHSIVIVPSVYYRHLYVSAPSCYYYDWIFCYTSRANGYYIIDDYPFYVYDGYYHRYSNSDICNYQLVDSYTRRVKKSYWGLTCRSSYDQCAFERDILNIREMYNRFTCAETYRSNNYSYFNMFDENDYRIGGYNESSSDNYYENDNRSPDYDDQYDMNRYQSTSEANPSNDNTPEEISPALGAMKNMENSNGRNRDHAINRSNQNDEYSADTQDY